MIKLYSPYSATYDAGVDYVRSILRANGIQHYMVYQHQPREFEVWIQDNHPKFCKIQTDLARLSRMKDIYVSVCRVKRAWLNYHLIDSHACNPELKRDFYV